MTPASARLAFTFARSALNAGLALAQALSSAPSARPTAIVGGTVHTVSGADIAGGTVLIRGGKIEAVGVGLAVPPDAVVVDAKGKHVYPSLLPPKTVLGLVEISSVRATVDTTEPGEINPQARADFAMNFDSELLPVARSGGVLVAGVSPLGGIISGSLAAMKLDGWTREDAGVKAPAAISVVWPDLRSTGRPRRASRCGCRRSGATRRSRSSRTRSPTRGPTERPGPPRARRACRATTSIRGSRPSSRRSKGRSRSSSSVHRVAQIRAAIAWAKQENLRLVLADAEDGWRVADEIARAKVPVIVGQPLELPARQDETYDANFANAGVLSKAGVTVVFNEGDNGMGAANVRNLPHQAAAAVAFGFPAKRPSRR